MLHLANEGASAHHRKLGSEIRRLEARRIITFVKEHGGHLTHFNPLHNVKVVHVTSRPLCNDKYSQEWERSIDASAGKHSRTKCYQIWEFKPWRTAPWTWKCLFFPSINTYEQIRWACSLAPIALGPQHRRPNTPRWSRCPWSLETTWECTSATRILSAACVCNIWRQKVTAVLEFTRVKRPCGAF